MKKTIISLTSGGIILLSILSPLIASANVNSTDESAHLYTCIANRKVTSLKMLAETGFDDMDISGSIRIATFDDSTNTITYQNGIDGLTPDQMIYDTNEIIGYKSDGSSTKLADGIKVGNTMMGDKMLYKYKLNASEKSKYTHYDVNVKFHDPTWGYTGSAHASFKLN